MIAQVTGVDIPIRTDADVIYVVDVDHSGYPKYVEGNIRLEGEALVTVDCTYVYAVDVETGEEEGEALVPIRTLAGNLYNHSETITELLSKFLYNVEHRVHERDTEEVWQKNVAAVYVRDEELYDDDGAWQVPDAPREYDTRTFEEKVEDFIELMTTRKAVAIIAIILAMVALIALFRAIGY